MDILFGRVSNIVKPLPTRFCMSISLFRLSHLANSTIFPNFFPKLKINFIFSSSFLHVIYYLLIINFDLQSYSGLTFLKLLVQTITNADTTYLPPPFHFISQSFPLVFSTNQSSECVKYSFITNFYNVQCTIC